MKKIISLLLLSVLTYFGMQAKKILGHDDFDNWKKISNNSLSSDGQWASYTVEPQEGDGILFLYNVKTGNSIEIERGYNMKFTPDSKWAVALIKPKFKDTRQAKIDKKKDFDMPQDSLVIVELKSGKIERIPNVISYKLGKEKSEWLAWLSSDTVYINPKQLKDKEAGKPLFVRKLGTQGHRQINWVKNYVFNDSGDKLGVTLKKCKDDSLATSGTGVVLLPDTSFHLIDRDKPFYGEPVFNTAGTRMAYTSSTDSATSGTLRADLFMVNLEHKELVAEEMPVNVGGGKNIHYKKPGPTEGPDGVMVKVALDEEWVKKNLRNNNELFVNQYSKPEFSHNGKRLVIGVAPYIAPDDTTIVDFERADLDIWRWDAPYTPPMENNMVKKLREQTFPVVIDLETKNEVLVTDNPLVTVFPPDRWDADWAMLEDPTENIIAVQWDYQFPVDIRVKNVLTGELKDVVVANNETYRQSPTGKYILWFYKGVYYTYNCETSETKAISMRVPYPLWEETLDMPFKDKSAYGVAGWTEGDKEVFVYDRYDVWALDPQGVKDPICVTAGEGRKKDLRMRVAITDPDFRYFKDGETILYDIFNYLDKRHGLATSKMGDFKTAPRIDFLLERYLTQVRKSKDANVYSWVEGNFNTAKNVFVSTDIEKSKSKQISDSNPQMADYSWGTAQLVKWTTYDGSPAEGVLYLPEDFDESKSYPMISYFYEESSDYLYYHYDMEPSWSWINFPFYVSRGYVIFVPDVKFVTGIPGESSRNYVCSGVEEMCRRYPNIDKNRLGIDGQSWGGYQTAYLVTRTNMFACAGSGAPVANMTSAYGGIRWGTGDSRQAQYEVGQSRIGRTLWEAPELYITNSPLFMADKIETPLLIMHNDADGAVPWYQGIELFMALRRLGKPVWMLTYNGEAHNIKERRNRKDITIRLQQFFDHYLKGTPMPEWMEKGIPAVRKGQEMGY